MLYEVITDEGDVPGAVADEGGSFLGDGGNDELALFPVGEGGARGGIDNLGIPEVLVHVHAVLALALEGDAGAGNLRQAVNVVRLNIPGGLDFLV